MFQRPGERKRPLKQRRQKKAPKETEKDVPVKTGNFPMRSKLNMTLARLRSKRNPEGQREHQAQSNFLGTNRYWPTITQSKFRFDARMEGGGPKSSSAEALN